MKQNDWSIGKAKKRGKIPHKKQGTPYFGAQDKLPQEKSQGTAKKAGGEKMIVEILLVILVILLIIIAVSLVTLNWQLKETEKDDRKD